MALADRETKLAVTAAIVTSIGMLAFQTAAKATRDAFFLTNWDVTTLPTMVIAASFVSLALAYVFSWLMPIVGPSRLVPATLVVSALLLVGEWRLLASAPAQASVIVYLHYAGLGALIISGFWSIVSEHFDPQSAKKYVGRIAAGATVGGLLGGVLTERVGAWASVATMLPILAGLHILAALLLLASPLRKRRLAPAYPEPVAPAVEAASGFETIKQTPILRNLVALVFFVTVSEMLIDYVFKVRADDKYSGGEGLLRFFAVFYTVVSLLTTYSVRLKVPPQSKTRLCASSEPLRLHSRIGTARMRQTRATTPQLLCLSLFCVE